MDGKLYISGLGGDVCCIDASTGQSLRSTALGAEIYESSPAISGDLLAIGSVDGTLWLLRTEDGAVVASHRFSAGLFLSTPAAGGGRVYAATFAERLAAFDVSGL